MTTSSRRRLKAAAVLTAASFLLTALLFTLIPGVLRSWDLQATDRLFLLRRTLQPPPYDSSIIHIDIGNSSVQKLSYYFPRRYHAHLMDLGRNVGFSALAYDIIFAQRLGTIDDSLLLSAASASKRLYVPVAFSLESSDAKFVNDSPDGVRFLDSTAWTLQADHIDHFYHAGQSLLTWPELSAASRGVGFISVETDLDGVFRRVPLLIRYKDKFYPSMVFRLACDLLRVPPQQITVHGGSAIVLHNATTRNGVRKDLEIPIDERGNMAINWIGSWEAMTHISFAKILEIAEDRDEIDAFAERYRNAIAFVGDNSTGISDIGPTPFEEKFVLVGLHANTLNTILTEHFLRQAPIAWFIAINILIAIILIACSVRFSSVGFTISAFGIIALYVGIVAALFLYGGITMSIIQPPLAVFFSLLSVLVYRYVTEEKEKEQLRARFESYFPPAVVKQMLENPDMLTTAPQQKDVTIMFSDIKSFTTHSSHMTPEEISTTLSEYFEAMTAIVFKYGGTVDKFIGDGLMVFYGAPEPQSDHAVRCVQAAIEMQKKCRELKARWEPAGRLPLKIRIGINSGPVVVGDLGSERRKEYTVIGSDVNLAQRLESNAPVEGILISEAVYHLIKSEIRTIARDPIIVKGLETPIVVFEVPVE